MKDLRDGIIRTPLPPMVTFHDDPLRLLRAVRFAARFGFTLHDVRIERVVADGMHFAGSLLMPHVRHGHSPNSTHLGCCLVRLVKICHDMLCQNDRNATG